MPCLHFSFCAGENSRPLVFQSASATMRSMRCFEFESRHSDQKRRKSICSFVFFLSAERFESLNATVRWTVARDGWTEPNHNFRQRRKCKRISTLKIFEFESHLKDHPSTEGPLM